MTYYEKLQQTFQHHKKVPNIPSFCERIKQYSSCEVYLKGNMFLQLPVAFVYKILGAILQRDIPFERTDCCSGNALDSCQGVPVGARAVMTEGSVVFLSPPPPRRMPGWYLS
jgi:hypothetical protein